MTGRPIGRITRDRPRPAPAPAQPIGGNDPGATTCCTPRDPGALLTPLGGG